MTHQQGAPVHTATRPRFLRAATAAGIAALLAVTTLSTVDASSHREAPLIAEDPVADNTDTYAFVSPSDPANTVLIANYIPLQAPDGGPNFHNFGEDVLYAINVDNDGDAVADVTYEFTFDTQLAIPTTTLYNVGPITSLDDADWNLKQTYTLSVVRDGVRTVLGQDLPVPPNNLGPRSTPDYAALATEAIVELDGGVTAFAGQRDDPFWVDLGSIFDLGALRPFEAAHLLPTPDTDPVDAVAGTNTHSLVLEVPSSSLTNGDDPVIGVWATASRRQVRTFAAGNSADPVYTGPFRQVSRLGMPLVNEVVIPLALKDTFNTLLPSQDAAVLAGLGSGDIAPNAAYQPSTVGDIPLVTDPELAGLFEILYPTVFGPEGSNPVPPAPRNDLVTVFLTGVPDVNQLNGGDFTPAEYIRLNTAIAPAGGINDGERLGVIGGDNAGFPNGRRLIDDTVDLSLRVVAGELVNGGEATPDLTDGVLTNDLPFLEAFPYVAHPHSGYYSPAEVPADNNL
jgi:hypothetical protein